MVIAGFNPLRQPEASPQPFPHSHVRSPRRSGPNSSLGSCEAPVSSYDCYYHSGASGAALTRVCCELVQGTARSGGKNGM